MRTIVMRMMKPGEMERLAVRSKIANGASPTVVMMLPRRKYRIAICVVDPP